MKKKILTTVFTLFLIGSTQVTFAGNNFSNPKKKEAVAQKRSKKLSQCKQTFSFKKIAKLMKSKRKEIAAFHNM